jgi:hypothetical protein
MSSIKRSRTLFGLASLLALSTGLACGKASTGSLGDGGLGSDGGPPGSDGSVTGFQITSSQLPNGRVGQSYVQTLAAVNGTTPYDWSIAGGTLPGGLSLSKAGVISGVPTAAGSSTFMVSVSDASSPAKSASASLTLTIDPASGAGLMVTSLTLMSATVGQPYSASLTASGGTMPYQWALDPMSVLPAGLMLGANGQISGTPTIPGRYFFIATVVDASSPALSGSGMITLQVRAAMMGALTIEATRLPDAFVGMPYQTVQLRAARGRPPYSWTIAAGMLAPGMTLSSTGAISGTPSMAGNFDFNVQVTDTSTPTPQAAQASLRLTVLPPGTQVLAITPTRLRPAFLNQRYGAQLDATGGTMPYAWGLVSGMMPPGLTLSSTGAISGTPTSTGAYPFTVRVADSGTPQQTAQGRAAMVVFGMGFGGLRITTRFVPIGMVNHTYTATLAASGGTTPYTWSIANGSLPRGITLSAQGMITGTSTSAGISQFEARVTDSAMPPAHAQRMLFLMIR